MRGQCFENEKEMHPSSIHSLSSHTSTHLCIFFEDFHCLMLAIWICKIFGVWREAIEVKKMINYQIRTWIIWKSFCSITPGPKNGLKNYKTSINIENLWCATLKKKWTYVEIHICIHIYLSYGFHTQSTYKCVPSRTCTCTPKFRKIAHTHYHTSTS